MLNEDTTKDEASKMFRLLPRPLKIAFGMKEVAGAVSQVVSRLVTSVV